MSEPSLCMLGLYPPPMSESDEATLNLLRMERERVDLVPIAHGPVDEVTAVEQRLLTIQAEGDTVSF